MGCSQAIAGWPGDLLSAEVQPDTEQAGTLLQRIGRGALQIEAQVERCAAAARPADLLRAELLPHHRPFANLRDQLTQRPGLVRFRIDVMAQNPKAPATHAEHLI